ncbi:acetate kinase, partial [Amaricoccus sp. HAR-UPW-R2A-40]
MADAILVLNAGSSSLKFTGYLVEAQGLAKVVSGKAEELTGAARFQARDASGAVVATHAWD